MVTAYGLDASGGRIFLKPPRAVCLQCPLALLPSGVNGEEREADHTPLSSTEVRNKWRFTSINSILLHGVTLWHSNYFTFSLTLFTILLIPHLLLGLSS
jgi:hypothetical protein